MARSVSKRSSLLVALSAAIAFLGMVPGARASHATAGVIEQAGNGAGATAPLNGLGTFHTQTVLYSTTNFTLNNVSRVSAKYAAWGTPQGSNRVHMVLGSDDGLRWQPPVPAVLSTNNGSVPFVIKEGSNFAVAFNNFIDYPNFEILYVPTGANTFGMTPNPVSGGAFGAAEDVDAIHYAASYDGITWFEDRAIQQVATSDNTRVITGATSGSFKRGTNGPVQLIYNLAGATTATCAATTPWACRYVMVYDVIGVGDVRGLAVAGSPGPYFDTRAVFRGHTAAILTNNPGQWDATQATLGTIRCVPNSLTNTSPCHPGNAESYQLFYSGATAVLGCGGGTRPCHSIGVATSTNGLNFTKVNPVEPATASTLLDNFGPPGPASLLRPIVRDDTTVAPYSKAKIFFTRLGGPAVGNVSTWLAYTGGSLSAGPTIVVSSPTGLYRSTNQTPIEFYVNDSSGGGILFNTMSLTIDGIAAGGAVFETTLVGATKRPGWKVTATGPSNTLADGEHTLNISIRDSDGNVGVASRTFEIDSSAPASVMTTWPTTVQYGWPDSIGTFTGSSEDRGTGASSVLARMRATVTNPLGEIRFFESNNPQQGWTLTQGVTPASLPSRTIDWRWAAPVSNPYTVFIGKMPDLFFAYPGPYTVTVGGVDLAGNVEKATADNTRTVRVWF